MSRRLFRLGAWVFLAGAAVVTAGALWFEGVPAFGQYGRLALGAGIALMLLSGALLLLEKAGVAILQRRCARCRRIIPKGHIYCADHLKKSIEEAQEKLHGRNGTGI